MTNKIENAVADTATKQTKDTAPQFLDHRSSNMEPGGIAIHQDPEPENQFFDDESDEQSPEQVRDGLLARIENMKSEGFDPIVMDIGAERKSLSADAAKMLIANMRAEDLDDVRIINGW